MIGRFKSKSFWVSGVIVFLFLILLTFYQMFSALSFVFKSERQAFEKMSYFSTDAANLYADCAKELTKNECFESIMNRMKLDGKGLESKEAIKIYKDTIDQLTNEYEEPWPLNILGILTKVEI